MNNEKVFARQGDVYLLYTDIPEEAKKVSRSEEKRHVLAYGEVTGHAHAIYDDVDKYEVYLLEQGGVTKHFLKAKADIELKHGDFGGLNPDHDTIKIPKGYSVEIRIQRQYNYWTDSPERVRD